MDHVAENEKGFMRQDEASLGKGHEDAHAAAERGHAATDKYGATFKGIEEQLLNSPQPRKFSRQVRPQG